MWGRVGPFLCGELMTIRASKRGSAGTSISINCLGASGLSYCGYPKRSVPGANFWRNIFCSLLYLYQFCGEIFFALFYIIILRNLY